MINPGTEPVADTSEEHARTNLAAFLQAVEQRGGRLASDPVRDPAADRDGRFGWDLNVEGADTVRLLMPGVELEQVRDDRTPRAPCLYVNGAAWWWNDAVNMVIPIQR